MQSVGIVLILCGAFLIYEVLHSRLPSQSGSGSSGSGGGGGGSGSSSSTSSPDIGTHSAIDLSGDATGVIGSVYTVNSTYGAASGQQQDDMNAFAHQNGG